MITPQQSKEARDLASARAYECAEVYIDERLKQEPNALGEWWFSESILPAGISVKEIARRYEAAGWVVRREFDQREGNALVFRGKS